MQRKQALSGLPFARQEAVLAPPPVQMKAEGAPAHLDRIQAAFGGAAVQQKAVQRTPPEEGAAPAAPGPGAPAPEPALAEIRTAAINGQYDGDFTVTPAADGKPATWVGFKNSNLDKLHKDYIGKWGVADPYAPCDGSESDAAKGDSGGKMTGSDHFKWLTVMQEKLMGKSKAEWDDDAKAVQAICTAYLVAWNKKKNGGAVHASVEAGYGYVGGSLKNERASEGLAGGATSASTNKKNWCAQASTAMFMIGLLHNGMTLKSIPIPNPAGKNEGPKLLQYLRTLGNSFEAWKAKYLSEDKLKGSGHEKGDGYQPGDIVSIVKAGGPPNGHVATVAASDGKTAGSKLDIISGNAAGVKDATDGAVRAEQLTIADSPPGYNYDKDRARGITPQIGAGEVVVVSVTKTSAVDASQISAESPEAMKADMEKYGLQAIDLSAVFGTTPEGQAKIDEIIGG